MTKKRLYKCESCYAYYENKNRAEICHNEGISVYEVEMIKISKHRHLYTDKRNGGKRINYCFYCKLRKK
jgi:hypothetical protein